ncbi:hypothetical protein MD484_g791, partial [Candolleomyces efflorescens]
MFALQFAPPAPGLSPLPSFFCMVVKSFVYSGARIYYEISKHPGRPVGDGKLGDLHFDSTGGLAWVRTGVGWTLADTTRQPNGLPAQTHPTASYERRLCIAECVWKSRNYWYIGRGRAERLAWLAAQATANTPQLLPTVAAPVTPVAPVVPITSALPIVPVASVSPVPVAPVVPIPSTLPIDPVAPVSPVPPTGTDDSDRSVPSSPPTPASRSSTSISSGDIHLKQPVNPANAWLSDLLLKWVTGPSSLVEVQKDRGRVILETLLTFESPIKRLNAQGSVASSLTCDIFGTATREGPRPSPLLAMVDLLDSTDVEYSDSYTNTVERNVSAADFWNAQLLLAKGCPLGRSGRLLSVFDIPATKKGLLSCKYVTPFMDGVGCALSALTNSWTLAGAITHPHADGIGAAVYVIHWKGFKIWLIWPPTLFNLLLMEHTMTTTPHLDTTIDLILRLENLEVLVLDDTIDADFSFCLRPHAIHCCLSFTEGNHLGVAVRDTRYLADFTIVMDWACNWIPNTLVPDTIICDEEKAQVMDKFRVTVQEWRFVHDQLPSCKDKVILSNVLRSADDVLASTPDYESQ